ncbi:hypothetical protein GKE82_22655 [Conexibacter sp. W3-3-2]|uniref:Asl1-like glycosyl hydrolase catalytic domain-containing protein n=1 Tax=Paraconexibacter algicola TaxID=2133960 RepID=A0A2T4UFB8_9ACTN|nr:MULTISPECIES: hypothetical protein [Solirubrobacterales]MTD47010.1 hypothetical protein [Conexibacter sp. W3-3-2]PTL56422.1 hypothetical protein C7Y72_15780 [Paraconexibacter algicola]
MRRIALLASLAATGLLAVPATGQAAFTTGIGDQQPSMFSSPFFPALKVTHVRYIVSWDAMNHPQEVREVATFMAAAKSRNAKVLVAFNHSRFGKKSAAPSPAAYGKAVAKFHAAFKSQVEAYQTWNEINHCGSQPAALCKGATGAKRAAALFKELKKRAKGKTIVAVDLLDGNNAKAYRGTAAYAKNFVKFAKSSKPTVFGLHNYSDTNRSSATRTKFIVKNGLPKNAKVWVTETGGIAQFGGSFPFDLQRQARSVKQAFKIAGQVKQIKRLYLYNWTANEGGRFDSGLVDASGNPRPAYTVAVKRGK